MELNAKVIYSLARKIARELEEEADFEADPEAYTVGLFVAVTRSFPIGGASMEFLKKHPLKMSKPMWPSSSAEKRSPQSDKDRASISRLRLFIIKNEFPYLETHSETKFSSYRS